jgi:hypothetical protein
VMTFRHGGGFLPGHPRRIPCAGRTCHPCGWNTVSPMCPVRTGCQSLRARLFMFPRPVSRAGTPRGGVSCCAPPRRSRSHPEPGCSSAPNRLNRALNFSRASFFDPAPSAAAETAA